MLYAFDGTWNDDGATEPTNVLRLARAAIPGAVRYYRGVGNQVDNQALDALLGGMFARGLRAIVARALADRARDRAADPVVDVIGFSRGCLAAMAFLDGVVRAEAHLPPERRSRLRFAGLLDAVDAIGHPDLDWDPGWPKRLPRLERAVHAVALHETRATFQVVPVPDVETVGFIGNHCDIGGGYRQRGLSDISLAWLRDEAERAGVPFVQPWEAMALAPDERQPPHRETAVWYAHAPRRWPPGLTPFTRYAAWPALTLDRLPWWPLLRQVAVAKAGARSDKRPGARVDTRWEFIPGVPFTRE